MEDDESMEPKLLFEKINSQYTITMDALLLAGYGSDSEEEDPVSSRAKRDRSIIPEAKVRPNVPLSTIVLGACGNSSSSSDDEMKDRNLTTRKRKNSPSFGETETKKREAFLTSDRLPPPLAQKLSTRNIDAKTRTFRDFEKLISSLPNGGMCWAEYLKTQSVFHKPQFLQSAIDYFQITEPLGSNLKN